MGIVRVEMLSGKASDMIFEVPDDLAERIVQTAKHAAPMIQFYDVDGYLKIRHGRTNHFPVIHVRTVLNWISSSGWVLHSTSSVLTSPGIPSIVMEVYVFQKE